AAVPDRYGVVQGFVRNFLPRPDDASFFAERMTVRLAASAPINDPASPWRPLPKVMHRADERVQISAGSHTLIDSPLVPLRGWYPVEVLHFPFRSVEQLARKATWQWNGFQSTRPATAYHTIAYQSVESGQVDDYYASLAVDDAMLEDGLRNHTLEVDT